MNKHKHQRESVVYNYVRGYNELYDNLPPPESFINGMALIHLFKRKGTGAFYDDHWLNLICDEVNKDKFIKLVQKINKQYNLEIKTIIHEEQPPINLIQYYYDKLVELGKGMKFYIGNPNNYLTNYKDE